MVCLYLIRVLNPGRFQCSKMSPIHLLLIARERTIAASRGGGQTLYNKLTRPGSRWVEGVQTTARADCGGAYRACDALHRTAVNNAPPFHTIDISFPVTWCCCFMEVDLRLTVTVPVRLWNTLCAVLRLGRSTRAQCWIVARWARDDLKKVCRCNIFNCGYWVT